MGVMYVRSGWPERALETCTWAFNTPTRGSAATDLGREEHKLPVLEFVGKLQQERQDDPASIGWCVDAGFFEQRLATFLLFRDNCLPFTTRHHLFTPLPSQKQ